MLKEKTKSPINKRENRNDGRGLKETNTGAKVKLFYDPADLDRFNYETSLGDPGSYPYTRGIYPEMYRKRLWTM